MEGTHKCVYQAATLRRAHTNVCIGAGEAARQQKSRCAGVRNGFRLAMQGISKVWLPAALQPGFPHQQTPN